MYINDLFRVDRVVEIFLCKDYILLIFVVFFLFFYWNELYGI